MNFLVETGNAQRIVADDARCMVPSIVLVIATLEFEGVVSAGFPSFRVGIFVLPDTETDRSISKSFYRCLIVGLWGLICHCSFLSVQVALLRPGIHGIGRRSVERAAVHP